MNNAFEHNKNILNSINLYGPEMWKAMHEKHACRKVQTYFCTYMHKHADTEHIGTPPENYLQHTYNTHTFMQKR